MIKRIIRKIKNTCWNKRRKRINAAMRKRLKANDVSIISSNCNGGVVSHDLGLQFRSPTVNLYFRAEDFIKFCENLSYYLDIDEFTECTDSEIVGEKNYPIAYLGDILLFLVHYASVEEAQSCWNRRKKRINFDSIVIMTTDRDGMNEELKERFERLPYRKVMFTHLPDMNHPDCFYIPGYENMECVGTITDHDTWDGSRPIDKFDYIEFLNGEEASQDV